MNIPKFFVGAVVYLNSGSKNMTVKEHIYNKEIKDPEKAYEGKLICTWEENGKFEEKEFHENMLEKLTN